MRVWIGLVAVAVVSAALALQAQEAPARDRDIELLVADANGAPPEFAADALVRIASAPKVADPDWQRELLDDAYMRAYAAQESYRRITGAIPADTRQGAEARAGETGLTRVSLQLRAVQAMAPVDPAHARELFEWIDLDLEMGACSEALVPAVDEYYTTLSVLARTTFPPTAAGRGEAVRFLELFLWRAHLPTEMPAVARALQRFRPTRDEAAYLDTVFRWILEAGLRDPRSFSVASLDIVSKLGDLEDADRELGLSGWYVSRALRQYLIAQLTGSRCSDSQTDGPAVDMFNGGLKRRDAIADGIASLTAADTRPSRLLGIARIDPYWQTSDARRLHDQALRLRGTGRNPVPDSVRRTLWFAFANRLTELTRSDDRRLVLDLLENSHHPVLSLYGRLERTLATKTTRSQP